MRFFKAYCIAEYVEYLERTSVSYRKIIFRKEQIKTVDITARHYEPRNDLGLRVYNYLLQRYTPLFPQPGRPPGTHNTVIGRNQLGLRRYDFTR